LPYPIEEEKKPKKKKLPYLIGRMECQYSSAGEGTLFASTAMITYNKYNIMKR
jgi:hypothetical protein